MARHRALVSVSNKQGLEEFARGLVALDWEIVSTGGTARSLEEAGIPVTPVFEVTGFPEILEGRVKTLHPKIHGGILARRETAHLEQLNAHQILPIDLVVVNLYPFQETIARSGVTREEAIENIDIGGPSMVRGAAKNFQYVTVVVNPNRYGAVLDSLRLRGEVPLTLRMELAAEAFAHTAEYDQYITTYLQEQLAIEAGLEQQGDKDLAAKGAALADSSFPEQFVLAGEKVQDLRYGENPHQRAAFYRTLGFTGGLGQARQLHGKELSFNNLVDLQAAWGLVKEFNQPAAGIVKHTNPCGTAERETLLEAYQKALEADPVSAFGGIVALNRPVDEATASALSEIFLEVIVAPYFEPEALSVLQTKKNVRLIAVDPSTQPVSLEIKTVEGGFLVQEVDQVTLKPEELQVVTKREPTPEEWEELKFAWKVVKHIKSNAIVVTRDKQTLGVGAGQMNRVGSARIALEQAGEKARGSVMGSDAFFPFRDTVDEAARAGVTAIIQPGGSVRDEESIQAANAYGITMVFTGIRHFKH